MSELKDQPPDAPPDRSDPRRLEPDSAREQVSRSTDDVLPATAETKADERRGAGGEGELTRPAERADQEKAGAKLDHEPLPEQQPASARAEPRDAGASAPQPDMRNESESSGTTAQAVDTTAELALETQGVGEGMSAVVRSTRPEAQSDGASTGESPDRRNGPDRSGNYTEGTGQGVETDGATSGADQAEPAPRPDGDLLDVEQTQSARTDGRDSESSNSDLPDLARDTGAPAESVVQREDERSPSEQTANGMEPRNNDPSAPGFSHEEDGSRSKGQLEAASATAEAHSATASAAQAEGTASADRPHEDGKGQQTPPNVDGLPRAAERPDVVGNHLGADTTANPDERESLSRYTPVAPIDLSTGPLDTPEAPEYSPELERTNHELDAEKSFETDSTREPVGVETPALPERADAISGPEYARLDGDAFVGPPSSADVAQGALGDCYLCASEAAVADRMPTEVQARIREIGGDTYAVRLTDPETGKDYERTVTAEAPQSINSDNQRERHHAEPLTGATWPALYEKAFAVDGSDGYARLDQGGSDSDTADVLSRMTGREAVHAPLESISEADLAERITRAEAEGRPMVVGFDQNDANVPDEVQDLMSERNLHDEHAYSVVGIKDGEVQLRNPWSTDHPEGVSVAELASCHGGLVEVTDKRLVDKGKEEL